MVRSWRPGQRRDDRPPSQDRHLRAEQPVHDLAQGEDLSLDAREALHQRNIAKSVGGPLGEVRNNSAPRSCCRVSVRRKTKCSAVRNMSAHNRSAGDPAASSNRGTSAKARRSRRGRRGARGKSRPKFQRASVPESITFMSRPEWVPPWKLSGSCRTCSKKSDRTAWRR